MKQKIKQVCKEIEQDEGIIILFAVENGSRAWRMDSKDSDYDVRFVFARPLKEYIQIHKPKEVIQRSYDKEGSPCSPSGAIIDVSGFDVFKYVRMLSSSNPTTIEWLMSDIVYLGEQNNAFKQWIIEHVNYAALYHHYKSMSRYNYLQYIQSGKSVTPKKYLYVYRGLINALWVAHRAAIPPIIFTEALKGMTGIISESILSQLLEMVLLKSKGKEKDNIPNIIELDRYIEDFLQDSSDMLEGKRGSDIDDLNRELRMIFKIF